VNQLYATAAALALAGSAVLALSPAAPAWTDVELALVRSLSIDSLPPLPADPSNRVADDPRAAALGKALFFDSALSRDGSVSCASCHDPDRQFQDGLRLGRGIGTASRRTMPLAGAGWSPFLFWDGRKDSLWSQALGPLESPAEHGTSRTAVALRIASAHADDYTALFGPLPDLSSVPVSAGPVADPAAASAWQEMGPSDRAAVDSIFANAGKAIAAFERTLPVPRTRLDEWIASPDFPAQGLLSADEIAGLRLFVGDAECVNCHNGPLLTDNHFHNTGVPAAPGLPEDRGRETGAREIAGDPFNCFGPHSDAGAGDCAELRFMAPPGEDAVRAFKTPSLRGVASRPPYMHAGQLASLSDVIRHYAAAPAAPLGHSELRAGHFDPREAAQLQAFLATLDAMGD
jgi:cytochrome c peroxidase